MSLNEFKDKQTPEELDIFNNTIDMYLLWFNTQKLFRQFGVGFQATTIFFTPPKKDDENEKEEDI